MPSPFSETYLDQLSALIAERIGLNTYERGRSRLVEILHHHAEAVCDLDAYLQRLTLLPENHPVWQALLAELTIGETYFLRDEAQMAALRDHILPSLIQEKRAQGEYTLYLWSAGCATGEEPYTLAMLLVDLLPDPYAWRIQILGSDINAAALEIGRVGRYREWSLRTTPDAVREQFFTRTHDRYRYPPPSPPVYEIHAPLREMVTLRHGNLLSDAPFPAQQDLVLCRNVLIYFTRQQAEKLEGRLMQAVRPGGWLLLSSVETLSHTRRQYTVQQVDGALVYQKQGGKAGANGIGMRSAAIAAPATPILQMPLPTGQNEHYQDAYYGAVTAMQAGALDQAEALAEAALADSPGSPELHSLIAALAASRGQQERAYTHLKQALEHDLLYPDAHYLLALLQMESGEREAARNSLRAAIYCRPDFALAYLLSGDLFAQTGEPRRAEQAWLTARRFASDLPPDLHLSEVADVTAGQLLRLIQGRLAQPE